MAHSGQFSSDRSIQEFARDDCDAELCSVDRPKPQLGMKGEVLDELSSLDRGARRGAASPDFLGSFEGLNHPRKVPQAGGPAMRFAFLIHPLSQQTADLMARGSRWPVAADLGPGRPARVLHQAHAAFGPRHRPNPDGRSLAPRIADTFDGLVSAAGARAKGDFTRSRWMAEGSWATPAGRIELMEQAALDAIGWGAPHRRARLDDRDHRQPRRIPGRTPADRRDDGQQPDRLRDREESRALLSRILRSTWPRRRLRS